MSTATKTCPACGADLSTGTPAMPGVCPACGRDVRLEEIVATLPRSPEERPANQPPINLVECAAASIGLALILGILGGVATGAEPVLAFFVATAVVGPNFFAGFYIASRWKRAKATQLFFGFILGIGFVFASLAMLFAGCAVLGIR